MLVHYTFLKLISNGIELAQVVGLVAVILWNIESLSIEPISQSCFGAAASSGAADFAIDLVSCAEIHVHTYWTN
tara:strand:+ start:814 stop:1035 length:222 start_codon:yes stop_codon:yes gene_type:complete